MEIPEVDGIYYKQTGNIRSEPDASWYRPSNHRPNMHPNTYEQAADEKRKREIANAKDFFYNFLLKASDTDIELANQIVEGVKRGIFPDYYENWLFGLSVEERARRGLEDEFTEVETRHLESKIPEYQCNYIGPDKERLCEGYEKYYKKIYLEKLRKERREQEQ